MTIRLTLAVFCIAIAHARVQADDIPFIVVAKDKKSFVLEPSNKPFTPWGFNYDRDHGGRLLEDYWETEWAAVETHFGQMKKLGANVVRIHLQFGKFMDGANKANEKALVRLGQLLRLAEKERLYLDLTGLGCYHKKDVPAWYDQLNEAERWQAQANFWRAVAGRCAGSPAVFCYDLMNEPVVPGGKRKDGDWLGPPFAGSHFVQVITLDQKDRPRPDIARAWIKNLVAAIREKDNRHLITVGLVDWSLDRPGLSSGFVPAKIAADLDFVSVHLYPKAGKLTEDLDTLAGFAVGKPVVIEETFPMHCSPKELEEFIVASKKHVTGWIGFYWGKPPEELRRSNTIADAMTLGWLEMFATMKMSQ
jgi:Cellulase (glycosyl hydrolase family 5)